MEYHSDVFTMADCLANSERILIGLASHYDKSNQSVTRFVSFSFVKYEKNRQLNAKLLSGCRIDPAGIQSSPGGISLFTSRM